MLFLKQGLRVQGKLDMTQTSEPNSTSASQRPGPFTATGLIKWHSSETPQREMPSL